MTTHIWYSGATDITGHALAEALEINGTRTKPRNLRANDIVIGWGTKTRDNINLHCKVLNHPNAIRANRNKFTALKLMKEDRNLSGNIAAFWTADEVRHQFNGGNHGDISLPLIARRNYHQGGKGFWLCICKNHINMAINEGAQYFQTFIDIATEYRLHVFGDKVIYAAKKVEHATEEGWVKQRREKILNYANKNNVQIDQDTMNYVLKRLYKEQQLPDRIVRSNRRGWKFSTIAVRNLPAALKNAAIRATSAIGLDFAAVDCCLDNNNHPWIIEANSGPGLQGTSFNKYVAAFREKLREMQRPARPRQNNERVDEVAAPRAINAVGADMAENENNNENRVANIGDDQLRLLMNAVNSPEEARRVLDIAMGRA